MVLCLLVCFYVYTKYSFCLFLPCFVLIYFAVYVIYWCFVGILVRTEGRRRGGQRSKG